ncbi:MAG: hypothetical protein WD333_10250, partial [Dehalococcoidia bacterium]
MTGSFDFGAEGREIRGRVGSSSHDVSFQLLLFCWFGSWSGVKRLLMTFVVVVRRVSAAADLFRRLVQSSWGCGRWRQMRILFWEPG